MNEIENIYNMSNILSRTTFLDKDELVGIVTDAYMETLKNWKPQLSAFQSYFNLISRGRLKDNIRKKYLEKGNVVYYESSIEDDSKTIINKELLSSILGELKDPQDKKLASLVLLGLSQREISKKLNIKEPKVCRLMSRLMKRLKIIAKLKGLL